MNTRPESDEPEAVTPVRCVWTAFYALTLVVEAVGFCGAALLIAGEDIGAYVLLPYTAVAVVLLVAGVLSLSMTSPERRLHRLIWTREAVLVAVWAVVILLAHDPYVPGSCSDIRTGCVRVEDAARPAR